MTGRGWTLWCRLRFVGEMTVEAPGGADPGLWRSPVLCHRPPGVLAQVSLPVRVEILYEARRLLQIRGGSFALGQILRCPGLGMSVAM